MSSVLEEQEMELEALESIYPSEFKKLSDREFRIEPIVPFPDESGPNHVSANLLVAYTDDYPSSLPDFKLETQGINADQKRALHGLIKETMEENLGMPMTFTVVEAMTEWLRENNIPELSMHEQMLLRDKGGVQPVNERPPPSESSDDEGEEEEGEDPYEEFKGLESKNLCRESERITVDQFKDWKISFDLEMIKKGLLRREDPSASTRLTGRQEFEQKHNMGAGGEGQEETAVGADGPPVVYDDNLFIDELDDEELEELLSSDEE